MQSDREIGAFDLAVVKVLVTIDEMMMLVEDWIPIMGRGLNFKILPDGSERDSERDKRVEISPLAWPEDSFVRLRLILDSGEWVCDKGEFTAHHVAAFGGHAATFTYYWAPISYITPRGENAGTRVIAETLARRRPELAGRTN